MCIYYLIKLLKYENKNIIAAYLHKKLLINSFNEQRKIFKYKIILFIVE